MIDIDVQIEGVSDRTVADAIRQRVRRVRQQIAQPGEWRVAVSPSETRGQWDLGMRAPSGWHFASFTEAIDTLPDLIERKLREFLELDRLAQKLICQSRDSSSPSIWRGGAALKRLPVKDALPKSEN